MAADRSMFIQIGASVLVVGLVGSSLLGGVELRRTGLGASAYAPGRQGAEYHPLWDLNSSSGECNAVFQGL